MEWLEILDLVTLTRLLGAAAIGGLIGLERQISGKPAGFRTNILICVGAALATGIGARMSGELAVAQTIVSDPGRMTAGIITGIGFLGAGVIMQARGSVLGLTTAATIWVVAALGIGVGAGHWQAAVLGTVVTIVTLYLLEKLERGMAAGHQSVEYAVVLPPSAAAVAELRRRTADLPVDVFGRRVEQGPEGITVRFSGRCHPSVHDRLMEILLELGEPGGVAERPPGDAR